MSVVVLFRIAVRLSHFEEAVESGIAVAESVVIVAAFVSVVFCAFAELLVPVLSWSFGIRLLIDSCEGEHDVAELIVFREADTVLFQHPDVELQVIAYDEVCVCKNLFNLLFGINKPSFVGHHVGRDVVYLFGSRPGIVMLRLKIFVEENIRFVINDG